jgi:hypothetical protein
MSHSAVSRSGAFRGGTQRPPLRDSREAILLFCDEPIILKPRADAFVAHCLTRP